MDDVKTVMYEASAILDAAGLSFRPGSLAVRGGRIVAAGSPAWVRGATGGDVVVRILRGRLLLPSMVNAHAHLDLTSIGARSYGGDFVKWVRMIQQLRPRDDQQAAAAVHQGAAHSFEAGVCAVGDIAGSLEPKAAVRALGATNLFGVSFAELLGMGGAALRSQLERLASFNGHFTVGGVRSGLQPHAPYSSGPGLYNAATALAERFDLPLCTHLSELGEEQAFVARAVGPLRTLLETLGRWSDDYRMFYGQGQHPIDWMVPYLRRRPWLLAHCNYVEDRHIKLLATSGASVAYCPIASDYFGHRGHRYRDLMAAGVNVCLGTDSVVCQPSGEHQPLGILGQMRYLFRRDGTDPVKLLAMATINGGKALGLVARSATLQPGSPASIISVPFDDDDPTDPLTQVLKNRYPVQLLMKPENVE